MILRSITNGKVSGTGSISFSQGSLIGGIVVSTDGTNEVIVIVRRDSNTGKIVFDLTTHDPVCFVLPIETSNPSYYSVTGTGAGAMFYEYVE